ncbi:MAG: Transcription termination factor NusA [Parcubacteria group bacterium GW2011_GWF2_38_76]|nr:MAG: Transcription termination factor NusA [Parcubacteria group bacterium GW2011_GWF2_38_76]HBM46049.1 transcription termination/antitermination protein NusA [Patescibacteria group bacterium]
MIDLKALNSALIQLEEEKGIPKDKVIEAIEMALAAAYKKDYGKKNQIIRAKFDLDTGATEFIQVKMAVDDSMLKPKPEIDEEGNVISVPEEPEEEGAVKKVYFNEDHHIMINDAKKIKKGIQPGEEIIFPLETKDDYGRIAAQTAKQVIIQRIREAEKSSVVQDFGAKQGEVITGKVQRVEGGNVFVDLGRATGILPKDEQVPGERYRQGERIRAYLYSVEDSPRGINLKLSRSHPLFITKLFEIEAPEVANGVVEIKSIAREAGSRSKIAVYSNETNVDPVGSCVGQRGTRVSTVINELGGEKIDIIPWSEDSETFITNALSPAKISSIKINEEDKTAVVKVDDEQFSLAIGKGGQNVRLAAKLTGWKIDIKSSGGAKISDTDDNIEDVVVADDEEGL